MATGTVRLTDAIVPDVFANYMFLDTTVQSRMMGSGIVRQDGLMASRLSAGGVTFQTPFWGDLADDGDALGTDNPADVLTPSKISASKHQFIRQYRAKAWSTADLVAELAGSDPMKRISSRVGAWWARRMDSIVISTLKGLTAANVAQNSSDMVYDATGLSSTHVVGNVTVNNSQMSGKVLLNAAQQLGETKYDHLNTIIMHSQLYTMLELQNLIIFREVSGGLTRFPTYLGFRIVVSDQLTPVVDGSDLIYTSYLTAPGIIGFGESPPDIPVETKREPLQGNGAGVETLITRRQFAMSPYWYSFTNTSVVDDNFPTNAELELATNWSRKATERKQIPIVVIKTKNG